MGRLRRLLRSYPTRSRRDREWQQRAIRDGRRVRLLAVVAVALALPFAGNVPVATRVGLAALVAGYHVLATGVERYGERHDGFPTAFASAGLGLLLLLVGTPHVPQGEVVALLATVLLVAYWTAIGGLGVALVTGGAGLAVVVAVGLLGSSDERITPIVTAVFAATLVGVSLLVDGLTRDRLQAAYELERLYGALRSVGASPDLASTLGAIVDAADQAVDATGLAVFMLEGDHLVTASPRDLGPDWTPDRVAEISRRELAHDDGSPLALAFSRRETIVVRDVADDRRFPEWSRAWAPRFVETGVRALVTVPLHVGGRPIGVLSAAFGERRPVDEAARILQAYAEPAALVIVRAQAYDDAREVATRLAEADRMKSEFLALVSHELRTPLTAAKGFVDTVLWRWDVLDDARKRELLGRASTNAEELSRLIHQLLDYSRLEAAPLPADRRSVPLRATVDGIVEGLAPLLAGHEVSVSVPPGLVVLADVDGVTHVVTNLLSNAARFAPSGRISVAATDDDGEVTVTVTDEGPGIPVVDHDRIFERFSTSSATAGAAGRGTGLGLAIARRYVEREGGRIWVESEPGAGATFAFTLAGVAGDGAGDGGSREGPDPAGGLHRGRPAPTIDQPARAT